jgi:hypothetical protein
LWLHRWIEGYTTAPIHVNRFLLRLTVSAVPKRRTFALSLGDSRVHVDDASVHTGERQLNVLAFIASLQESWATEKRPLTERQFASCDHTV